jgi:hypothetical protein
MSNARQSRITKLLSELRQGREAARDELVTVAYPELRRIAARYLRQERRDQTLRVTGLVNEMYVRLSRGKCGTSSWTTPGRETR